MRRQRWLARFTRLAVLVLITPVPGTGQDVVGAAGCVLRSSDAGALPDIAYVVDGELVEGPTLADPPGDIERIETVCWDTAAQWLDVHVLQVAVLVHTRRGAARMTRESLRRLVEAQEKEREERGAYTDELLRLSSYAPPPDTYVYLTVSPDGWWARTNRQGKHQACFVFVGTPPELDRVSGDRLPGAGQFARTAGEPYCL